MKLSNHKVQFGLTIPMAESPAACIFIHLYVQTKKGLVTKDSICVTMVKYIYLPLS
jgi:hypothetical protein